jgi:hypothetical protein
MQCCGSETFISDPVSDPDPAFNVFRIQIRFRIRIRIRIQILDSNPGPDPGFEFGQKQAKTSFSFLVVLGLNYLNSLMRIRDGDRSDLGWKKSDPGSTSRIRNTAFLSHASYK